jgi:hypothetical protein
VTSTSTERTQVLAKCFRNKTSCKLVWENIPAPRRESAEMGLGDAEGDGVVRTTLTNHPLGSGFSVLCFRTERSLRGIKRKTSS